MRTINRQHWDNLSSLLQFFLHSPQNTVDEAMCKLQSIREARQSAPGTPLQFWTTSALVPASSLAVTLCSLTGTSVLESRGKEADSYQLCLQDASLPAATSHWPDCFQRRASDWGCWQQPGWVKKLSVLCLFVLKIFQGVWMGQAANKGLEM